MDHTFFDLLAALRDYRLQHDLTYKALAEKIGLSESRVFEALNSSRPRMNERTRFKLQRFHDRVVGKAISA